MTVGLKHLAKELVIVQVQGELGNPLPLVAVNVSEKIALYALCNKVLGWLEVISDFCQKDGRGSQSLLAVGNLQKLMCARDRYDCSQKIVLCSLVRDGLSQIRKESCNFLLGPSVLALVWRNP